MSLAVSTLALSLVLSAGATPSHPVGLVAASCAAWLCAAAAGTIGYYRRSLYLTGNYPALLSLVVSAASSGLMVTMGVRTEETAFEALGWAELGLTLFLASWALSSERRTLGKLAVLALGLLVSAPAFYAAWHFYPRPQPEAPPACETPLPDGSCPVSPLAWTPTLNPEVSPGQEIPSLYVSSAPEDWFDSEMYETVLFMKRGMDDGSLKQVANGPLVSSAGEMEDYGFINQVSSYYQYLCLTDEELTYDSYSGKVRPYQPGDCADSEAPAETLEDVVQVDQLSRVVPLVLFLRTQLERGPIEGEVGGTLFGSTNGAETAGFTGWVSDDKNFCVSDGVAVYSTLSGKYIAGSQCPPPSS